MAVSLWYPESCYFSCWGGTQSYYEDEMGHHKHWGLCNSAHALVVLFGNLLAPMLM